MTIRVSIDVGGTFTDLAVVNDHDGRLRIFKASTTPEDFSRGIINAISMAADSFELSNKEFLKQCSTRNGGMITYGTTIATNALIEKKVAKVGLLCTEGHRDILTLREGDKEDPYYWDLDYPEPYVPRYLTLPVRERIDAQGNIIAPLDEAMVREAISRLKDFQVEAIAVAFLWSIVNSAHEERVGEIIEEDWPGRPYVLSHRINPIPREYRRTISTVVNASLIPIVGPYLRRFEDRLRAMGYDGNLSMISSFGGIMSIDDMEQRPVYSVDSGPTGAPVAGLLYARKEVDMDDVITCDMGGTSFEVSRVSEGIIQTTLDAKMGIDYLGIRKVDTRSIGAGGGSIARVDSGGLVHVGPESAGSYPGPSCYMRGGTQPTVTDANVVLGYLNPNYLLGGQLRIDKRLAFEAINDHVASALRVDVVEAAFTVWSTACANMGDAIRAITAMEGVDPREYAFVAGGGAAGTHILPIISDLGCEELIIPRIAGALSAVGGIHADMVAEFQRTFACDTSQFDFQRVNEILSELRQEALEFLTSNHIEPKNRKLEFSVDARYYSQPWNITIPLRSDKFGGTSDFDLFVDDFHSSHEKLHGSKSEGTVIECIHWRVKAIGETQDLILTPSDRGSIAPYEDAVIDTREAYFRGLGGMVDTSVFDGNRLETGNKIEGPAIIEETETTIVVFPGSQIRVSPFGNYVVKWVE